jgi:hypothetical protein
MADFTMPYFGQLNLESLQEYYSTEFDFNNTIIEIDLNFESKSVDLETMTAAKAIIEKLPELDQQNKVYINRDYNDEDGDSARFYLDFHLEEIGTQKLAALLGLNSEAEELEKLLLANLHLVRVGLYPNSEEIFAVFDYSLGRKLTNYIIVVNLDRESELDYITVES